MSYNESVLCLPKDYVSFCHDASGFNAPNEAQSELLKKTDPYFIPRSKVEEDSYFTQIIPYVVLRHPQGIASYVRSGNEERLHEQVSIGFGGHVSLDDWHGTIGGAVNNAMKREIREEVRLAGNVKSMQTLGMIYTKESDVSEKHLGVLSVWDIDGGRPSAKSDEMDSVNLMRPSKLDKMQLEDWARVALDVLS